jgi:ABC-2 type transport system permease protein
MNAIALPALTLWRREVVRFLRQPNRIVGAVGSPLLFWFIAGSGVGADYFAYALPGVLVLVLFFTAIFATISIIEDRREGFLQSVLVAPVPRAVVVLGKMLGTATLALGQVLLFLAIALLAGVRPGPGNLAAATGLLALLAMGLTGLGFVLAWRMSSVQGFHAVMNLVLLPLWVLSGALFPAAGAAGWIRAFMVVNPLAYGVAGARRLLLPAEAVPPGLPGLWTCVAVTALFALAAFLAAGRMARGTTREDLR